VSGSSGSLPRQAIAFCRGVDGVRIAWSRVGAGPPLVKTANWLNHLEYDWTSPVWSPWLRELARSAELIRYDARGTGLSSRSVEEITFEGFVRDLEAVVDACGQERFALLGVSQGCAVSVAYAVRHPERVARLVLYGGYARGHDLRGEAARERAAAVRTLIAQGWGEDNPAFRQIFTTAFVPDATREQMHWFNELQRRTATPEVALRIRQALDGIDVRELLPRVTAPTLVLHVRDDAVVPFEEGELLAAGIPGARFVPLEGRNHLMLRGEPAWPRFFQEVRHFLVAEDPTLASGEEDDTPVAGGAAALLEPGDRVGSYEVLGLMARGGMGEVYRARHPGLGREVALKTLVPHGRQGARAWRRFQREARLLASVSHPNIAGVHDLILEQGRAFIVMEHVAGETLRQRLERGPLEIGAALDVARQLAAALAEAHARGIVHRDLKPSNVILEESGRVKVLDFGLARSRESAAPMQGASSTTLAGSVLGTPGYMSPEQARGEMVDQRADIWAYGCVLYEMLSGRRAFDGESANDVMAAVLRDEPHWEALPDATPREVRELVRRCLVKDVTGRLLAIEECEAALRRPAGSRRRSWLRWPLGGLLVSLACL
jgi:pimeloyl-ACP methyl ester carboxylesterase/predicted Ser/Thr protein kinase